MTTQDQAGADGDIHIGTVSHGKRNAAIGIVVVALAGAGFFFYQRGESNDAVKLATLASFRAAFATKCNAAEFGGPTPAFVASEYLGSTRLQEEVTKQAALLAGSATCDDIEKALRDASFPMAKAHL